MQFPRLKSTWANIDGLHFWNRISCSLLGAMGMLNKFSEPQFAGIRNKK